MTILAQLEQAVHAYADDRTNAARAEIAHRIRQNAPRFSGQLADSIEVDAFTRSGTVYQARAHADAPQARWTDEGTGVYGPSGARIFPRNGRALTFYWPGGFAGPGVYSFRSVAGQPAQRWWSGPGRLAQAFTDGLRAAGVGR